MQPSSSLTYDANTQGQRFEFPAGRPRILTIAFTLLWFVGWFFLLMLLALDYLRFSRLNLASIAFLLVGGGPVAIARLWATSGKRESLVVTPTELRIYRWVGPIRLARSISATAVVRLRSAAVPSGLLDDFLAVRQFYGAGRGALIIDTAHRTLSVGHTLSADAATLVIGQVRQFLPHLPTYASEGNRLRRLSDYLAGLMTASVIGFAVTTPARLLIIDRPICFYDESVVPRNPIDVSRLRSLGRVYLVPIEDFSVTRATAIAEHFRTTFGVAIEVAPAMRWPDGSYVEQRGQLNSALMLTNLESMYATRDNRVVAIGLTTRDMFNPEVNWNYVFSYRGYGVAVISPARMDRGCMGLIQASEERIIARLTKMVGKNIGILHYGLDMSADPASMLYADIGGPQELDAMSGLF